MNQSIIELTKKAKREPFTKLRKVGADSLVVIGDLIPLIPLGSITSVVHKGIASIQDYLFCKKMGNFLETLESSDITDEQINNFKAEINKIPNFEQKINEYLLNLISNAESEEKAKIMGYIYVATVLKDIDSDMMLRLCSIVNRAYLSDLYSLPKYVEKTEEGSIAANNFIALGLIDSYVGGFWKDEPSYELNEIGIALHSILYKNAWFR
ncbi:MAG TPA: hypothetical protein K8W04_00145 [Bacteroides reticulotermitis]|nr:hypothetical protein [Bacteroides reticulotermitis]